MRNITSTELRQLALGHGLLYDMLRRGKQAALVRFKLAGPMGADPGVMPTGDEQSHGTDRVQYARREGNEPNATSTSVDRANAPDWLLDLFTTYDHIAPGRAHEFGQEVIG